MVRLRILRAIQMARLVFPGAAIGSAITTNKRSFGEFFGLHFGKPFLPPSGSTAKDFF